MVSTKPTSDDFLKALDTAIFLGQSLILEGISEYIDPILEPILAKRVLMRDGIKTIKLGDNFKEYNDKF